MLASVLAVPVLATRPAFAGESELGEVKDLDFRALILSTILMGIAGFTAVGAASTPGAPHARPLRRLQALLFARYSRPSSPRARALTGLDPRTRLPPDSGDAEHH